MRFILMDQERRLNCLEHIRQVNINKPMCVDIKPYKKNRSNSQNNLYHMWKKIIADETGETEAEAHLRFKVELIGTEKIEVGGVLLHMPLSTSTLDIVAFSQFLNKIEAIGNFLKLNMPIPDDYNFAMMRGE